MGEVNTEEAQRRARELADRKVASMYGSVNTPQAHEAWSRIFWREYRAYVSPTPWPRRRADA